MSMKNLSSGIAKSSIKSVSKSAMPDGKIKGMKSNNGIENAVSAIEGKERSEAILEAMYAFEEQHAQEFAQRDLESDQRWWQRMGQRTMIENIAASQKAQGAAGGAAALAGGFAGLGAGLDGLFGRNNQNQNLANNDSQNNGTHMLSEEELIEEGQDGKINGQIINGRALEQGQQLAQNSNEVEMNWQENSENAMDATDPESLFS
jgi:hypothetical protein